MRLIRGHRLERRLGGKDLRAAGRAPVHAVRQLAHLRVPALAGVAADDVGKLDYPLEGLQECPAQEAPAGPAAGRVMSEWSELIDFTERAGERVIPGGEGVFHLVVLSGSSVHQ